MEIQGQTDPLPVLLPSDEPNNLITFRLCDAVYTSVQLGERTISPLGKYSVICDNI